jgi:hypothetical protein
MPMLRKHGETGERGKSGGGVYRRSVGHYHAWTTIAGNSGLNDLEPARLDNVQKFECGSSRTVLTNLPLLYGRDTGVKQPGEDCLANLLALANTLDLLGAERLDLGEAQPVELAHGNKVHSSRAVQTACRFVNGVEYF